MSLAAVYLWPNGMVMAFDDAGNQIPELQGRLDEVKEKIARAITPETRFPAGRWKNIQSEEISAEHFR